MLGPCLLCGLRRHRNVGIVKFSDSVTIAFDIKRRFPVNGIAPEFPPLRRCLWDDTTPKAKFMKPIIDGNVPVINHHELIQRMMGSVQMAERMLAKFVETSATECDDLESFIRMGNVTEIASLAHRHKGTARTMAVPRVASIASEIEKRAATDPTSEMLELVRQLRDSHQQVREVVELAKKDPKRISEQS